MIVLGVDIGGTTIKCAFVTSDGEILDSFVIPTYNEMEMNENIERISSIIKEKIDKSPYKNEVQGIGVGCPGCIDAKQGICDFSGNLHWKEARITEIFEKKTNIKTYITNDANAHLLGEIYFGGKNTFENIIFLTLGTGIGGAMYLNGQLYEGGQSKGGELGHMVINFNGNDCTCGRVGCFESYASATALINLTKKEMKNNNSSILWTLVNGDINAVEGKTPFIGLDYDDETSKKIVNQYVEYLGIGALNLINIFRPDAIIIGGGVSNAGNALLNPLKEYLKTMHYGLGGEYCKDPEIFISSLGSDAGIYGAAALAIQK